MDSKEDKDKLIGCYKIALRFLNNRHYLHCLYDLYLIRCIHDLCLSYYSQKNCRYYRNGEGQCPFGNKCFYRHALPNGQAVDVGPPRRIMGAEGRVTGGHPVCFPVVLFTYCGYCVNITNCMRHFAFIECQSV